jgi:hypothetical protein
MMKSKYIGAVVVAAASALICAAPANAASASFELRGYVPVICSAAIQSFDVQGGGDLTIDAVVNQSCNSTHRMSVRYETAVGFNPSDLSLDYAGRTPSFVGPFGADFTDEGYVRETRAMHLVWKNSPEALRSSFAQTVTVIVTPT